MTLSWSSCFIFCGRRFSRLPNCGDVSVWGPQRSLLGIAYSVAAEFAKTDLAEEEIQSSGYVVHTLEACIWCLLTTDDFKEAVLKAVNLGEDTDTTGAVTGGLAGLLYGLDKIPRHWIDQLARKEDIEDLAERVALARQT